MSTIKHNTYTPELIASLRALVQGCSGVSEALDLLVKETGLNRDHIRRINRIYSIYDFSTPSSPRPKVPGKPIVDIDRSDNFKPRKIRRLFWDIETSPNVVLSWRIGYKINIDHDNLLKERAIICIGYKWEGDKEVHCIHWDKDQNDRDMLEKFLKIANEADELVAHNGDSFDMPWFKTRCLFHGLQTIPDYKTVDTLQWARRKFYFNSNKMDYIAKYLGLGGKLKTEFGLWKEIVLHSCPKALGRMAEYCKKDVILLEEVWERLSQVVGSKTHAGVLAGGERWSCPKDGSTNVKVTKTRVTANGTLQFQMQCNDCGSYYTISERAHADYLATK